MVAGDHRDTFRRTQRFQPFARDDDLLVESEVHEIAGHDDMVRCRALHVGDDCPKGAIMKGLAAGALPVDVAGDAL